MLSFFIISYFRKKHKRGKIQLFYFREKHKRGQIEFLNFQYFP